MGQLGKRRDALFKDLHRAVVRGQLSVVDKHSYRRCRHRFAERMLRLPEAGLICAEFRVADDSAVFHDENAVHIKALFGFQLGNEVGDVSRIDALVLRPDAGKGLKLLPVLRAERLVCKQLQRRDHGCRTVNQACGEFQRICLGYDVHSFSSPV